MSHRLLKLGPLAVAVALTFPAGAAGASRAKLRGVADEAAVVRGLLRIEDSLTYDAAAIRASRRTLARRIRARNRVVIGFCDRIIRDQARISRAERELHRAHPATGTVDAAQLLALIASATTDIQTQLNYLQQKGEAISITDMFEMQLLMSKLSQLSEMSTSVVSAANLAIASMARNAKI